MNIVGNKFVTDLLFLILVGTLVVYLDLKNIISFSDCNKPTIFLFILINSSYLTDFQNKITLFLQVLGKACKVIPVMLMGKVVSGNKYQVFLNY